MLYHQVDDMGTSSLVEIPFFRYWPQEIPALVETNEFFISCIGRDTFEEYIVANLQVVDKKTKRVRHILRHIYVRASWFG